MLILFVLLIRLVVIKKRCESPVKTVQDTLPDFQYYYSRTFEQIILESKWNIVIVLCVYKKIICESVCGKSSQRNTSRRNSSF